jgi:alcohol dehydrogenase
MKSTDVETIRTTEWIFEGPGRLGKIHATLSHPAPGELLVQTKVGAISPGTERTLLHGAAQSVPVASYPHQPGYLNVVTVIDAGDRTLLGDRGIAVLGHRNFALIPDSKFIRIPAGVPDELALLGVLAADVRHAVDTADPRQGEECLVIGGGIMGVLTAWEICVRIRGRVLLIEKDAGRRDFLAEIRWPGPVTIADRVGRRHHVGMAFDCASTADAFALAQHAMKPHGSILLIADGGHEDYVLSPEFFSKELFLGKTGSHPNLRGFLGEYFSRIDDRTTLLDAAFREDVRFSDFPHAYLETLLTPPSQSKGLLPRVLYP